ncbi:uncharacterized protein LOC135678830 [Musa acuminata AAA Group]|uniref:uncharacterized protein LOC103991687 n=1 Tax=Musa acuminata AAA Group TaxID=214697 RepID=UPI0031DE6609
MKATLRPPSSTPFLTCSSQLGNRPFPIHSLLPLPWPSPSPLFSHSNDEMTTARSYFSNLLSLFVLLFLHLGCFFFPCNNNAEEQPPPPKRRKVSPSSPSFPVSSIPDAKPLKSFSIRSYLSCILSFRRPRGKDQEPQLHPPGDAPVCPSSPLQSIPLSPDARAGGTQSGGDGKEHVFSGSTAKHDSFASRNDVYPCAACGEVLSKHQLLELHQATKHSLSELCEADSGYNIVRIIFQSEWKGKSPIVHRVLKIHNTTRTLAWYEEYRDAVRSRAARYAARNGGGDERCIADGNERLRFYCTTSLCSSDAGRGGDVAPAGVCGSPYCCACAIVRHGFAGKHADLDGIATHATSWGAHGALPQDLEREFAFLGARRAMLVCRVVAGRVAHGHGGGAAEGDEEEEEGKGAGFDSVVPTGLGGGGGPHDNGVGENELLVFSPRALLPCFVIMYTT